jgi:hypothetical protein
MKVLNLNVKNVDVVSNEFQTTIKLLFINVPLFAFPLDSRALDSTASLEFCRLLLSA